MAVSASNCISFQNTAKKHKTSTGQCHRFIPHVPQEFDCRVKVRLNSQTLNKDLKIRDEEFKTSYVDDFPPKISVKEQLRKPRDYQKVLFLRNVEEKIIATLPQQIDFPLSEMKDSFQMKYMQSQMESVQAPSVVAKCNVIKLGIEQQPAVAPNRPGYWKWTDPYFTTYKADYIIRDDKTDDALKEKIVTFYNVENLPPASGNKTMFDKIVFQNVLPNRLLARPLKRVPNFGMQSEYQNNYIKQTFSDVCPYLHNNCTEFEDSLAPASRWQNLSPPGMYCSEYCILGGKSVRSVVNTSNSEKEGFMRTKNCCPIRG